MSNHTIFKEKSLQSIFQKGLNKICNFDKLIGQECISLAFVRPIEMPLPMVGYMDAWVDEVQKKLDFSEKHSDVYADWLQVRVFTYDEFRRVIETPFSEEKFDRVEIYSYLYLDDPIAVEEFKIKYGNSEESIRSRYLKAIEDVTAVEFPELHRFLCVDKITLRYPISAFMKHTYCLAQTSSGKSEFKKHIFHELAKHPSLKSVIMLEPHMDLSVDTMQLRAIWKKGLQNVIYLDPDINQTSEHLTGNPLEAKYSFSINPFDNLNEKSGQIGFLVEHISKAFFGIINSEETFQMEAIIETCVETLLIRPNSDILDLQRFMDDNKNDDLVQYAINHLKGQRQELMKNRFKTDPKIQQTKSSIYYRLQSILGKSELIECLTGNRTVDIQKFMNEGKTIICNFSKAKLGPEGAPMLGKLFMGLFSGYATLRQNIKKSERMKSFVFIDEFQNYVNPGSTEEMFAEQRKYKTYFYVSNQQMGQSMSSEVKRIISGNTALKVMGDNESDSIEWFSKQFKKLPEEATFNLPQYSFWFYDKFNKNLGSFILRCPAYLVNKNDTYYLKNDELRKVFDYLVNKSGLYRKSANILSFTPASAASLQRQNTVLEHSFVS